MLEYSPRRWLAHGALALAAGVFAGRYLPDSALWALAAGASLVLLMLLWRRRGMALAYMSCFFFAGAALCVGQMHPQLPPEGKYQICATVTGEAKVREEDGRAALYIRDAVLQSETGETFYLDRLYWTYWPEEGAPLPPYDGQQVIFTGKVYQPSGQENPYGFDFRLYLLQKGVTAGVSGAKDLMLLPAARADHQSLLLRVRRAICARLELLLGDQAPLAAALIIGQTDGMPEDMRESFRLAGVAHVLSVSGLHAMLLMGLVIHALKRMQASPRAIFWVTGVLLALYSVLVGAKAPILRAAVLVGYQLYAHVVRRRGDRLTALALGVIVILLIQPLQLFAAGFQMSFAAVLGIVMLGDALHPWLQRIQKGWLHKLCAAYGVSVCANLGVLLPVAYVYNSVSLIGLLINPLVCVLTEALMLLFVFLLLVSLASLPLAQAMGAVIAQLSRLMVGGIGAAGDVPWATVAAFSPPWYLAAAFVLCLLLCTRYVLIKRSRRVLLGTLALFAACAVMLLTQNRSVRYIQLALGDADAAVIEDGRKTVVIDTGEYGGDLSSYLLATGRKADHLILTHLHADHALGLEELLNDRVKIGCIYLSTEAYQTEVSPSVANLLLRAEACGVPIVYVCAGDVIETPRVRMEIRWPEAGSGHPLKDPNDCAMALKIDLDGTALLHMSDVPGAYERYVAIPADILRAGHHGAQSSTREAFLQMTQPCLCIISGDDPSEKTLSRLAHAGAMVYDTGTHGAISVTVRDGQYFVEGYLQ